MAPLDIARGIVDAVNSQRLDALDEYWSPDLVEDVPFAGRLEGRETVRAYFAQMLTALPDFHLEIERAAAADETVFLQWRLTGTFSGGSWNGVEATGAQIDVRGMDCMTVRDGVLVTNFVAYDSMAFATQAGLLPAS